MEMTGQLHMHQPLNSQERTLVPTAYEARWPQSWSGRFRKQENLIQLLVCEPQAFQPIA